VKERTNIGNALLLIILLTVIIGLSITLGRNNKEEINSVVIKGNYHLSAESYLKFSNILNSTDLKKISSITIRDRIKKHPYIDKVDLLLDKGLLNIRVSEKKFIALLLNNEKEFLIDESGILIPKMDDSQNIDFPIISNPDKGNECTAFQKVSSNSDLSIGVEIIEALKMLDGELAKNISEIDLRRGKDIILQFAKFDYPVILGRENEISKLYAFTEIVNKQINNRFKLNYIDLRYLKFIYLGKEESNYNKI
jgi:cell division septal protein FtsQ